MAVYTIIGVSFAFVMTVFGASLVFFFKNKISKKLNVIFYGLSAGIMLAATVWSLIIPSINSATNYGVFKFFPAVFGIIVGALFIVFLDKFIDKINNKGSLSNKQFKLFLAVTIHNIPEGLAVGFAFGVALFSNSMPLIMSALSLAIGMGLQNFPEGAAISLPLKNTMSSFKSFMFGFWSAIVELVAGVIGILLSSILTSVLAYILGFAAGAMIYVIIEELLPEANLNGYNKVGTWCFIIGFCLMMILDVVFA